MNLTQAQKKKLETVQKTAQNMITRCKTSTPKVLLDLLLNMPYLPLKLEEIALKRAISLKAEGHWNYRKINNDKLKTTMEIIDDKIKEITGENPNIGTDKTQITTIANKEYTTTIKERTEITIEDETTNFLIFTDGSKDEQNKTGYGVLFCAEGIDNISKALPNYCSIFQAEATAISEASSKLNDTGVTNLKIQIYSDSQAVIKVVGRCYPRALPI